MNTERMKSIRIGKKLTQLEMAKLIGVTLSTYRNWELGANQPSDINEQRLKEVLNANKEEGR